MTKAWIVYQTKNHKANTRSILLFESKDKAIKKRDMLNKTNQDEHIKYFCSREQVEVTK